MRRTIRVCTVVALALGMTHSTAHSAVISVNFFVPSSTPGYQPEDVAGVVPVANWNNVTVADGSVPPGGLLYSDGSIATGVSMAWAGSGDSWNRNDPPPKRMWSDSLRLGGNALTISGVPATFDMIIYAMDWGTNEAMSITVNGTTVTGINTTSPDADYVRNNNYFVFEGISSGGANTAQVTLAYNRQLGGFQIGEDLGLATPITFYKADNTQDLNLGASWVDATVPGPGDTAKWDSTVTGPNTTSLGGDLTWDGIAIENPGGTVTINPGHTLTLGASGISMASATQDLVFNSDLALDATQAWNVAASRTLTTTGAVSGNQRLTKLGAGTVMLGGSASSIDFLDVNAGRFELTGGSLAVTQSHDNCVRIKGDGAVLAVTGGTLNIAGRLRFAQDGGRGIMHVTGGTVNHTGYYIDMGFNSGNAWLTLAGDGVYNGAGRELRMGEAWQGVAMLMLQDNAIGSFGTINMSHWNQVGDTRNMAVVTVADNATLTANSMTVGREARNATTGTGQFYQTGGTTIINGTVHLAATQVDAALLTGAVNLSGGTLTADRVTGGTGTAVLNFHGGTLKAGTPQADFIALGAGAGSGAYVYEDSTIDTGSQDVTINQPLLAPTGEGIASIAVANPGSGYFLAPPAVRIEGGGGHGATAIAEIDPDNGEITGITVTNPGVGYTSNPTVALYQGGGSGASPGTVSLADNSAYTGGLTKTGSGILTLAGANTYTGATTVGEGTLALSHASGNNVAESSLLHVAPDATLDVTGLGGGTLALASGQGLRGDGMVDGNVTLGGGFLAPGSEAGTGTLTFLDDLDISGAEAGALKFRLGDLASADFDHVDVGGNLLIGDGVLGWDHFEFTPLDGFGMGTYELFGGNVVGSLSGQISGTVGGIPAYLDVGSLNLVIVPEPSAFLLLGLALAGWLLAGRRRR